MTVTYARDEIIPISKLPQMGREILDNFKNFKKRKYAITRNNQIEAVIIPVDVFEKHDPTYIAELYKEYQDWDKVLEHLEIEEIVKTRKGEKIEDGISLEDLKVKYGL